MSGNIPASILNHRLWDVEWALITENNNFNMDGITIDAVNFSVTDIDGNTIDSKEEYAKNKYTILFQFSPYFGDFTDMKSFIEDIYDKYKGKGERCNRLFERTPGSFGRPCVYEKICGG